MIHLIPAWKQDIKKYTADEYINLINIFNKTKTEYKVILLDLIPNLRYIMNENEIGRVDYYSIWDDILNIQVKNGMPLHPTELNLPKNTKKYYFYGYYFVTKNDKTINRIKINNKGFINEVGYTDKDNPDLYYVDIYDDRGFKITQPKYDKKGKIVSQRWFNEWGDIILKFDSSLKENCYQVMNDFERFYKKEYPNLNEIKAEFLEKNELKTFNSGQDGILSSLKVNVNEILKYTKKKLKLSYLFDDKKKSIEDINNIVNDNQLIIDNEYFLNDINEEFSKKKFKSKVIYPYYTEFRLGKSAEKRELQINWNVNEDTPEDKIIPMSAFFMNYILHNDNRSLLIEAANEEIRDKILLTIVTVLSANFDILDEESNNLLIDFFKENKNSKKSGEIFVKLIRHIIDLNELETMDEDGEPIDVTITEPFSFLKYLSLLTVNVDSSLDELKQELNFARVQVDIGKPASTLMQFLAASAGVPNINSVSSSFVRHNEDGFILEEEINKDNDIYTYEQALDNALHFFLDHFKNWNEALVKDVVNIEKYSVYPQSEKWKEAIVWD